MHLARLAGKLVPSTRTRTHISGFRARRATVAPRGSGAGARNRTEVGGFGDRCSATELHRLVEAMERLELSTTRFGSERSILLSYTALICWRCQRCRRAIMSKILSLVAVRGFEPRSPAF